MQTDPTSDQFVPREPPDGCWTVDYDLRVDAIGKTGELSPGEVHTMTYTILDYDNHTCLPRGTYRFSYPLGVAPGGNSQRELDDPTTVTFSFAFILDEDGTASVELNEPEVDR